MINYVLMYQTVIQVRGVIALIWISINQNKRDSASLTVKSCFNSHLEKLRTTELILYMENESFYVYAERWIKFCLEIMEECSSPHSSLRSMWNTLFLFEHWNMLVGLIVSSHIGTTIKFISTIWTILFSIAQLLYCDANSVQAPELANRTGRCVGSPRLLIICKIRQCFMLWTF